MESSIFIDPESTYVCIVHSGASELTAMLQAREAAGKLLRQHGIMRLLIDVLEVEEPPETIDTFEVSSSLHLDFPDRLRIALLAPADHAQAARFCENVSNNRGFNVRSFVDRHTALRWLLDD